MFEMYTINADFCHKWKPVYVTIVYMYISENTEVYYKLKYTFAMAHSWNKSPTKPSNVKYCCQSCFNMGMNEWSNLEILAFLKCSQEIRT